VILISIDAQVLAALLTAIAGLLVALASGAMSYRQRKREEGWRKDAADSEHEFQERLAELESQLREREARSAQEAEAEEVLTRYREPLVAASYDLQRVSTTSSRGRFCAST
jgi:C4-dicarboxylate-specific signal transduction histidine kinase